jgi:hypothetical protein
MFFQKFSKETAFLERDIKICVNASNQNGLIFGIFARKRKIEQTKIRANLKGNPLAQGTFHQKYLNIRKLINTFYSHLAIDMQR